MTIKTIIVDDDAVWRDLTTEFVKLNSLLELVGTFDSAVKAYPFLLQEKVDLILLDVEMPQLDGLKFAKSLAHPPLIVFITSHAESAVEGFEVNATDFLVKPYTIERFFKMIERVQGQLESKLTYPSREVEQQYNTTTIL